MKIYIVFEDVSEAYEFAFDHIFKSVHLKEEDAINEVKRLENTYSDIYYEEIEVL